MPDRNPGADEAAQPEDVLAGAFDESGLSPGDGSGAEGDGAADGLNLDDQQSIEIRRIFMTTLPQYLEPVEELLDRLAAGGESDAEIASALGSMLGSIRMAAGRMGIDDVSVCLDRICDRVELFGGGFGPPPAELRRQLEIDLAEVKRIAGGTAGPTAEESRGRTIYAALRGAAGIEPAVLERLAAAGLTRVDQLEQAERHEIVAVSGLDAATVDRLLAAVAGAGAGRTPVTAPSSVPLPAVVLAPDAAPPSDPLHGQLDVHLRRRVEAEAALEEVRAQLHRTRARTAELREQLGAAERRREELRQSLSAAGDELARSLATLRDARLARDDWKRRVAAADAARERELQRLEALDRQQREAADEDALHERELGDLLARVERLLRSSLPQ